MSAADDRRRHDPERPAQGVHRPRHLRVPAPAVDADHHRHLRLLPRDHPPLEHHLHLRLPHPRGRFDGRAGDRLHAGQRHRLRAGGHRRRARRRRLRPPAVVLLERAQQRVRGGGQVPGRPPHVAPDHDRALRRAEGGVDPAPLPHPDRRVHAHRAAARGQHRARRGAGDGRGARGHAEPAHQRLRRGAQPPDRAGGPHRPAHAADHRLRERDRRHAGSAGRLVLRRVADRRGRATGVGVHRADRRDGRCRGRHRGRLPDGRDRAGRLRVHEVDRRRRAGHRRRQPVHHRGRGRARHPGPRSRRSRRGQVERVRRFKADRDQADVARRLEDVRAAARAPTTCSRPCGPRSRPTARWARSATPSATCSASTTPAGSLGR